MRRSLLVLPLLALAVLLAACSSADPGWTFAAPTAPPAATPAASADASGAPVATGAPVEPTPAGPTAVPGGGDAVQISALGVAFEQAEVAAPADKDFAIHFNNKDAGIQHNVEIKDASGMTMFKGDLVTGVVETDYQVKALAAGAYKFVCSLHPNMVGTLKVGG